MADYFVASGGSNTAPYDTWAKAATSLQTALTAATGTGDRVIIQYNGVPSGDAELASDTSYTFGGNGSLISASANDTGTSWTPTVMGTGNWIGNSTAFKSITLLGAKAVYIYGVTFRTSGGTNDVITVNGTTGGDFTCEDCYFWQGNTSTGGYIAFGTGTGQNESFTRIINCTLRFGATAQGLSLGVGQFIMEGGSVSSAGSIPGTSFINLNGISASNYVLFNGVDLSQITNTLVQNQSSGGRRIDFVNCKLGASVTVMAAQTTYANKSQVEVNLYNCSSGDQHYHFGHYNAMGETTISTAIYATDANALNKYDGTNRCSWKIVTTANAAFHSPYVSPWIERYCGSTSASISVSCQILRDGINAGFTCEDVWGEWSYQGSAGFTTAVMVNDRKDLAGSASAQATGMGVANWFGSSASSTSMVMSPVSQITPQEIGMLRCRVNVGKASTTLYVDPTVRYA